MQMMQAKKAENLQAHQRHNSQNTNELFKPVLLQKAQQVMLGEKKVKLVSKQLQNGESFEKTQIVRQVRRK